MNALKKQFIIHYDMDAFYAAVEIKDNPELRDKPLVIGALPGERGIIATCSYEARKFGIRSGISSTEAYRLCPHAVFMRPNFHKYEKTAEIIAQTAMEFSDTIEFIALDEAYIDVSHTYKIFKTPLNTAKLVKQKIQNNTGLTCSVGLGYNMMTAKLASEEKKPNGFFVLTSPNQFSKMFLNRNVSSLYGIGSNVEEYLNKKNIFTVNDLKKCPLRFLKSLFGVVGIDFYLKARGIDNREITPVFVEKSFGHQTTFQNDTTSRRIIQNSFIEIAKDLSFQLKEKHKWFRTLTMKIQFSNMKTINRSYTFKTPVNDSLKILKTSFKLLQNEPLRTPVRQVGLRVGNLTDKPFPHITFDMIDKYAVKKKLDSLVLSLRKKYGKDIVKDPVENYLNV